MISVLLNAYACSPHKGSEPGMGWNWIVNLSKYCRLYIITEGEWRDEIEKAVAQLPQKDSIHFFYLPVSERVREICWNQGDWRFYYYYRLWQKRALDLARQLMRDYPIDVVHQLNMIGFREPGYLWQMKEKPFVWGPIGGMNLFPKNYLRKAGWKCSLQIRLKNSLNRYQMKNYPRVRKAMARADILLAATPESQRVIQNYYHKDCHLISETGCYLDVPQKGKDRFASSKRLEVVWSGRFFYPKQLNIALETLAHLNDLDICLHIAGEGNEQETAYYKHLADTLGIQNKCIWHGKIPHEDMLKLMQTSHLLLFTSVSEATSSVVLEALQSALPVVCFNTCGFGAVVNEKVGRKIELSEPSESAIRFADVLRSLHADRALLQKLSANCAGEISSLSWDHKARCVVSLYEQALKKKKS